ncbi:MAG: stage II sporulation protein M [Pseudomonadota bacterium]
MKQQHFVEQRKGRWAQYDRQLKRLRKQKGNKEDLADFPARYRALCNDLALARTRGYSLTIVDQLEQLVRQGHAFLYQPRNHLGRSIGRFFAYEFPALVRSEWRLSLLACLLLFGPMIWLVWHIGQSPEFVYRVLSPETIADYESMYEGKGGVTRGAEDNLVMFSFYIMNNIGVALRTFGAGLVFGIGSAFILLLNGVQIGAVAAHLSFAGYQENFLSFVIGHGSLELPAIALAGGAGARMGLSLLFPGGLSRMASLRLGARRAVKMLYGVIVMLFLAAGLEAFWSASSVPVNTKYLIGSILWLLVIAYFLLVGRGRERPRAD